MADTKQLVILKRLTAHLQGITPDNGYQHDLSAGVYRGKSIFGKETPAPFISIVEGLRPDPRPEPAGTFQVKRLDDWDLLLQGWADDDGDNPTDALYLLKGDVEKRMAEIAVDGYAAYRLGGLLVDVRIGPGVVRSATPQAGGVEAFYLPLMFRYVINLLDPFAL